MATTFKSSKAATGVQARNVNGLTTVFADYDIGAALVVNDVIEMVKIPAGATIQDVCLAVDSLDDSTGIVLAVGDSTTAARFISGSTIGRNAAGVARLGVAAGLNYKYEAETTINVKVTTAPTTGATSGKIRLAVTYTNQF